MFARFNHPVAAVLAGVTASFIFASTPSLAQNYDDDVVVQGLTEGAKIERVSYRDLNLRYIAHLNILNERVDRAVRHVCDFQPRDIMAADYRKCADSSWARARPQIHLAYLRANRLAAR